MLIIDYLIRAAPKRYSIYEEKISLEGSWMAFLLSAEGMVLPLESAWMAIPLLALRVMGARKVNYPQSGAYPAPPQRIAVYPVQNAHRAFELALHQAGTKWYKKWVAWIDSKHRTSEPIRIMFTQSQNVPFTLATGAGRTECCVC